MANKRKAAIVTIGLLAIAGVAAMPAWLRLKEIESKGGTVGSTRRAISPGRYQVPRTRLSVGK